jgi:methylated-DNA-[protein]-cysteine S-methyltransferase
MTSTTIETPVGPFTIVGRGKTVLASGFTDDVAALVSLIHPYLQPAADADGDLEPITDAVEAFFEGDLAAVDTVDVEQHAGGKFLEHAWDTLRTVPPGTPVTYTTLAEMAGRPAAVRAAAMACARNAAALFVPCHRIIRSDGSLGGYRWGLEVKRWLLGHEQSAPKTES